MNINASSSQSSVFEIASMKKREAVAAGEKVERPQRPANSLVNQTPTVDPPAEVASGASAQHSYTARDLQHLMADWGVSGSVYDLNGDGTVNVTDMLQMISGIGGPGRPWEPKSPSDPAKLPMNANTLAHIQVDWGQTDSRYDINGDGIVNVSDLLHVLSNWDDADGAPPTGFTAPDGTTVAPPTNVLTPAASEAATATETKTASSAPEPVAATPTPVAAATPETQQTLAPAKLKRLSAAMIERLMNAGYTERPPVNIREIVAKLNLEPTDRRAMMAKLREHYANGLGVNLKA